MHKIIYFLFALLFLTNCKNQTTQSNPSAIDYRPVFHFTPDSNWINDANGLVYFDKKYHLFYQYNPFGTTWGHMSWGHATSTDMLHWQKLPIALQEQKNKNDNDTTMFFSGSTVIDSGNSTGFGINGKAPMVAIYTAFVHSNLQPKAQHQNLAYSNDEGMHWTIYDGNPVLDIHSIEFRDPKVFWYAPQQKWVMIVSKPDRHQVYFYDSKNLKEWKFLSRWGRAGNTARVWECPDLVEMPVKGSAEKKWVLMVSAGHAQETFLGMQYFVGDFDGQKFTPVQNYDEPVYLDGGKDFYAAVSFSNMPGDRKVIVGWLNNWEYANDIPTGNVWRGAYAVPRELSLVKNDNIYQLVQQPVIETNAIKKEAFSLAEKMIDSAFTLPFKGNVYEMELTMEPTNDQAIGLKILKSKNEETVLQYDNRTQELLFDRTHSGNVSFHKKFASIEKVNVPLKNGKLKLHILVDKSVVEVFVNDGEKTLTDLVFPLENEGGIELFSKNGTAKFSNIRIWTINM